MSDKYEDIMHMERPVSKKHPPMKPYERAAQFSPFSALTGFGEVIVETERQTQELMIPDAQREIELNRKYALLASSLKYGPSVNVTYFQPDERKQGGNYVSLSGIVRKIDEYEKKLVMLDGKTVPFEYIWELEGDIFDRGEIAFPDMEER